MKHFIKVSNKIFAHCLSPAALKVYCYLQSVSNKGGIVVVRKATIGLRCGIASLTTVSKALRELQAKALLSASVRHGHDGYYIASEYTLHSPSGRWFRLPFCALSLPKSAFSVYAYLCRVADNRSRFAVPSLNTLATALHMAKNTVIKAISHLVGEGIIGKARKWAGKHNLYIIQPQKKGDPHVAARVSQATMIALDRHHVIASVASATEDVKSAALLFSRVVQKLCNSSKTLPVTTEKENKNYPIRYLLGETRDLYMGEVRPNAVPSLGKAWAAIRELLDGQGVKSPGKSARGCILFFFLWQRKAKACIIEHKGRLMKKCESYGPRIGTMRRGTPGSCLKGWKCKRGIFSLRKEPMDDCAGSG